MIKKTNQNIKMKRTQNKMTFPVFPLFNQLYTECMNHPNKYILDNNIKMTISTLPDDKINVSKIIYYIIHHYYMLKIYQKMQLYSVDQEEMWNQTILDIEPKISNRSRKSMVYLVEYGGKTFEHGNGIIYTSDVNIPPLLKQIIAAYLSLI